MGNKCIKGTKDEAHFETKQKNNASISNSTQSNNNEDPAKNPFKKKRGEGYIPPHLMNDNSDSNDIP